ncbi:MAG: PDZ domain-containing protein [Leptospiraceae bacterium]|nr:PDZ domain-containing protein [Leptospiraceae bacterium]
MRNSKHSYRRLSIWIVALMLGLSGLAPLKLFGEARNNANKARFTLGDFDEAVLYTRRNYLDADEINSSVAYAGAAEFALRSLPYSLVLMSRAYYDNRERLEGEDILPGEPIMLEHTDRYLIFKPDYHQIRLDAERESDAQDSPDSGGIVRENQEEQAEDRPLTPAERIERQREKRREVRQFMDKTWTDLRFSRDDFLSVLHWIEEHKSGYDERPVDFSGDDPYADDPFGMHHVYLAAVNGYLTSVDAHATVMDKAAWDKLISEAEDSSFSGIGAMLREDPGGDVIVESPLPGSPALSAGLRAGDVIRRVDGTVIAGMELSEVVNIIRGEIGTTVTLEVYRELEQSTLSIPIKRDRIEIKAVSSTFIEEERIGIIKITSFLYKRTPTTAAVFKEYNELKERAGGKLKGLVLDLRGNPGGRLEEAIRTAGLFLPQGVPVVDVVSRNYREEHENPMYPIIEDDLPIIVLVNANSASASEILASALMDHDAALILGERTFGKASVQSINALESNRDFLIKLTAARYYSPEGYTVQVYGVVPDIKISDEEDPLNFPPRFREEDMWRHLPELQERKPDPARTEWIAKLQANVGTNQIAEQYLKEHEADAVKPDYMLRRALSYFPVLRQFPAPVRKTADQAQGESAANQSSRRCLF